MSLTSIIDILSKFRYVDKYESFHEILPFVLLAPEDQKQIVTEILDHCCSQLLFHFNQGKKPSKILLKTVLIECMDALAVAPINAENREFGYQLGWYLADKVEVNLKKGTEKKLWGYWLIEKNEVKLPVKPRISKTVKEKMKCKKKEKAESLKPAEVLL